MKANRKAKSDAALVLGVIGACAAPAAQAQAAPTGEAAISVQNRARPDLDPVPVRFGTFDVVPTAEARLAWDDNIYATRGGKVDDALATVSAALAARSTWSRHALSLDADGAITRGLSQPAENTRTYGARLGGRLDFGRDTQLSGHVGHARAYEPRGSIGDTTLRGRRIAYDVTTLGAEARHAAGRLVLEGQAGLESYRYAPYRGAGIGIAGRERDYRSWNAGLATGYAFAPGIAILVEGDYNEARYPDDSGGLDRSSRGWSARGGLALGMTRLVRGRAAIGYQSQRYDDPAFPRIRGLDFSAALEWNPTRLLTWTLEARRTIQRSPLVGVAGIRQSRYGARIDYEWRRNVLLSARLDHTVGAFGGTARRQTDLAGAVTLDWLANRHLRVSAQGTFQSTRSNIPAGRSFDRRRISLTVRYAL